MSLFDPYSHARIAELRNERLARAAKRREAIGLEQPNNALTATAVRALLARVTRQHRTPAAPRRGAPALDS